MSGHVRTSQGPQKHLGPQRVNPLELYGLLLWWMDHGYAFLGLKKRVPFTLIIKLGRARMFFLI